MDGSAAAADHGPAGNADDDTDEEVAEEDDADDTGNGRTATAGASVDTDNGNGGGITDDGGTDDATDAAGDADDNAGGDTDADAGNGRSPTAGAAAAVVGAVAQGGREPPLAASVAPAAPAAAAGSAASAVSALSADKGDFAPPGRFAASSCNRATCRRISRLMENIKYSPHSVFTTQTRAKRMNKMTKCSSRIGSFPCARGHDTSPNAIS